MNNFQDIKEPKLLKLGFSTDALISQFAIAAILAFFISFLSFKLKLLTKSGGIAVFILAVILYGFGGWMWTVPMVTFFILSSLISRVGKNRKKQADLFFEKSSRRDFWQVAANGGTGGILAVLYYFFQLELFYIIYVSSIAAVCADTWATEIGTFFKSKTYNILSFKIVEPGESGGVSLYGFAGVFFGAFVIAVSALSWINLDSFYFIALIIFAGAFGSIVDSILGASVQYQLKCVDCMKVTEKKIHCGKTAIPARGKKWMNNDMVNFSCGISGGLFGFLIFDLI